MFIIFINSLTSFFFLYFRTSFASCTTNRFIQSEHLLKNKKTRNQCRHQLLGSQKAFDQKIRFIGVCSPHEERLTLPTFVYSRSLTCYAYFYTVSDHRCALLTQMSCESRRGDFSPLALLITH